MDQVRAEEILDIAESLELALDPQVDARLDALAKSSGAEKYSISQKLIRHWP